MPLKLIIGILFVVLCKSSFSQTIVTLAPQTNCPNSFYVDYIATAKLEQQKLIITGELLAIGDAIDRIEFSVQSTEATKAKLPIANNLIYLEKAIVKQGKTEQLFNINKTSNNIEIKPNNIAVNTNNIIVLYINLPTKSTSKDLEIIFVCTAYFKKGCKYIKKQKISWTS